MSMLRVCDPGSLVTFLNSGAPFNKANLLTITLVSGTVIRLTDYDSPVVSTALGTFPTTGPLFKRSGITHRRGVEVDGMQLTLSPRPGDLLAGVPWLTSIRAGALDYATVKLDVAIFELATPTVLKGTFNWFYGNVADIPEWTTMGVSIECKSELARLDIQMPRNLIQPGCLNTLFDKACTLDEVAARVTGTVSAVNGDGSLQTGLAQATGFFDEGVLTITSGNNNNVVRKVKRQVSGALYLFAPFVFPVLAGTTFRVTPGCPKTKTVCNSKFSNVVNFRGFPYVPTPETVL